MSKGTTTKSVLGRLLAEISWDGEGVRRYRDGGLGLENVLTAEVFLALDFLPRGAFLGGVLGTAQGAQRARQTLIAEIENATLNLLPGAQHLAAPGPRADGLEVQPDALLASEGCYCVVEAKRIRRSAFQPPQLARELVLALRDAGERQPLLLLILGSEPPVAVAGHGRLAIKDAIAAHLPEVLAKAVDHHLTVEGCIARIDEAVAWTTWKAIASCVASQTELHQSPDPSTTACVRRLAGSVLEAIERHA